MLVSTSRLSEVFESAIKNRRVVLVTYEPGARVIEPHCLGYGSDGQLLLRAFQVEGASASGEHVNWKLFRLDRMTDAAESGQCFDGPRPDYNPNDKVMKRGIIAAL